MDNQNTKSNAQQQNNVIKNKDKNRDQNEGLNPDQQKELPSFKKEQLTE